MRASIALQILPLSQDINCLAVVDKVTPFETVLEGDWEELMAILKKAIGLAGEEADNIFANVKINYGEILTIDEKLEKYDATAD